MNAIDSLYREEILEHYRSPLNFGEIKDADAYSRQTNPLCGDDISMWVKFGPSTRASTELSRTSSGQKSSNNVKIIKDVRFFGKGCAICIAAASILTDYAKGRKKSELTKFTEEDMLDLLGLEVSETRKKCAVLALYVLKDSL